MYIHSIIVFYKASYTVFQSTPLLLAAKEGHSKIVKLLLDDVADVSIANEEGHNCLIEAILSGHR